MLAGGDDCTSLGDHVCRRKWDMPRDYAGSTSIFLAVGSSVVMRKLRTWPARIESSFATPDEGPLFQRALSMALSDAISRGCDGAETDFAASLLAAALQIAITPSPNSTFPPSSEASIMRPVTTSPALCSAMYSS